jgi:hypothetical protein
MPNVRTAGDEEGVGCRRPYVALKHSASNGNIAISLLSPSAHIRINQERFPELDVACNVGGAGVAAVLGEYALHHVAPEDADGPLPLLLNYLHVHHPLITVLKTRH